MAMDRLTRGNLVSIAAGLLILVVLVLLALFGISYAFTTTVKVLLWLIWALAPLAYIEYRRAVLRARFLMEFLPPIAIAVTFIGLILVTEGSFLGLVAIVLGYTLEPAAGASLFLTMKAYRPLPAYPFFIGASAFVAGLPLYLVKFPYLAIAGDVVKLMGLLWFMVSRGGD